METLIWILIFLAALPFVVIGLILGVKIVLGICLFIVWLVGCPFVGIFKGCKWLYKKLWKQY